MVDSAAPATVVIPDDGIGPSGEDVGRPTVDLLRRLSLLPLPGATMGFTTTISGAPDSVAVIEAGLTAGSKWWAVAIGGSSAALSAAVAKYWSSIGPANQPWAILAVGLVLAAGTLGIAYILGSDVRGRAAASVATVEARSRVAVAMLSEAQRSSAPQQADDVTVITLGGIVPANNDTKQGSEETGWHAIAARARGHELEYLLVKGTASDWVAADSVRFV